ncbi:ABC transporter permease [Mycetocola tolaasinivorans]|uniref:ABC transporter permease n=1 Tax=Mycetocola tolaasinivorans TaxID=76635 RepID=A0A3L6ZZ55_9MICO|nr:ABC transporter permease [Mycetocola tolaasinivorans]RLP73326.1 ABC transporter permease [Mycetocola tolaasinivorans]
MSGFSRLLRHPAGLFGLIVVAVLLVAAGVSLVWTPHDPVFTDSTRRWLAPTWEYPFGTDNSGRDIFSLILAGSRVTVLVAVGSALGAGIVGLLLAAFGALTRRWVRESVAVLIDVLIAFPTLLIAMLLAAAWGGSLLVVIVAVSISFGVNIARVTRPEIRTVLAADYVLAARASGIGSWGILRHHVLPNIAPIVIVQLSWGMALAVLAEAGLSYLGYGAPADTPSWGRLLSELQTYIGIQPLSVFWPGAVITVTVLGLNLLGDGLRDVTDPTLSEPATSAGGNA